MSTYLNWMCVHGQEAVDIAGRRAWRFSGDKGTGKSTLGKVPVHALAGRHGRQITSASSFDG